ncbi:adenosine deaminase [Luteimicrobium subarcticum]|uniref:Adenine deaminase n=1 Tax=Luteimicrobium subarcticum TaxID=620910 RepID=A0A2M8W6J0_9MICO|nr:adenosine deaminase [Luteimicrobium subarcticum]PJI86547.1 adenosine deaminase [Luteimicrobium subarcticum]
MTAPRTTPGPLPVAELHLHLDGTLEPEHVLELAARNGVDLPFADIDDLRSRYEFTDLQSFLDLLYTNLTVLRERADFTEMVDRYLERAAAAGVRHAEVSCDVQAHTRRGIPLETVMGGLRDALDRSVATHGVTTRLLVSFWRDGPVDEAFDLLRALVASGIPFDGIGLDSAEVGFPPELFTDVFAFAREHGLHVVAHGGEEGGPEYVTGALDALRAERIDHGIRSLEDDALVERLVAERVPLTVCPLSNVRLRAVDTMADHPLLRMLERGLVVSVHSDDPPYFGGQVDANVDAVVEALGASDEQLAHLARNSFESAFLADDERAGYLAEVDAWLAARGGRAPL